MPKAEPNAAESWACFYVEHRRALTAYALALTGNTDDATDLMQDVLVRMVRGGHTPQNAKPFVMRSLRNLAIDRWRSRKDAGETGELAETAFLDDASAALEVRESVASVAGALRALSHEQREVVVLKIYGEMTFQGISEVLGRPLGTVTSTYARGLTALRTLLDPEESHANRRD